MKTTTYFRSIIEARRCARRGPVLEFLARRNPRYGAATLGEYHQSHPNSVPIPTITQRGLIGQMLELEERKARRAARRRAALERVLVAVVDTVIWLKKMATTPLFRHTDEHLPHAAPDRA